MSLQQLRTFVEVYRCRSLSDAARSLGMTQPGVSQHIAVLEAQLGRPLFERHARGVRPTYVADDLAASLGASLDLAEASFAEVRARAGQISGTVHLAGPADFMAECISPRLVPLLREGLSLRMQFGGREQLYGMLLEGRVDLAITVSMPNEPQLAFEPLAREELKAVAAPATASRIMAAEGLGPGLTQVPDLAYDLDRPMTRAWLTLNGFPALIAPPPVSAPDLGFLKTMLLHDAGWGVLPDFMVEAALEAGTLVEIAPPVGRPSSQYYLVWARSSLRTPRIVFVRDFLLKKNLTSLTF